MNHPLAWLVWAVAAAVPTLLTRNPLYLTIIALAVWLVQFTAGQHAALAPHWRRLGLWGTAVWLITLPVAVLTQHQGQHILWRLPAGWPFVGGPATIEGVAIGISVGLTLWTLLLILIALYSVTPSIRFLRLPPFLRQAEMILTVALAFWPELLRQTSRITQAQRLRGRRLRNLFDRLPIVWPALVATLAHSRLLAETLAAHGTTGPRSRYRRIPWRKSDGAIVGLSALALIGTLLLRMSDRLAFAYAPATALRPEFNAWIGLLLTLLALPGLITLFGEVSSAAGEPDVASEAP